MASLEKSLFSSLAHFLIGSFIFLELSCRSCLYIFEIKGWELASAKSMSRVIVNDSMRGAELQQLNMSKNLIVYKMFAIVNRQKCCNKESLNCSSSNKRGKHFSFIQWLNDKESACQWRGNGFDPWVEKIP